MGKFKLFTQPVDCVEGFYTRKCEADRIRPSVVSRKVSTCICQPDRIVDVPECGFAIGGWIRRAGHRVRHRIAAPVENSDSRCASASIDSNKERLVGPMHGGIIPDQSSTVKNK